MFKDNHQLVTKRLLKLISICSLFIFNLGIPEVTFADNANLAGEFYERAITEYRHNNNKAAIIELKNAIQQNPDYLAAYVLLAEIYLQEKNLILTEVSLSKADKRGADPDLLVRTRAQLYLYQLKYSQIIKDILPKKFNKNLQADLHIYRGHAYLQLNQIAYALNEYKAAASISSNRIEPLIGRANALLRLNNIAGATEAAEQASLLQPNAASSWYIKGSIKHAQNLLQDALIDYEHAIKNDPQHQDARIAHAGILMDLQQDTAAEADLIYLRESYPFNAKAAYLHSIILARNNQENKAKEALQSAAKVLDSIDPKFLTKHSQSLMLSGLVNYSLKRFSLARHYLELYAKEYPQQVGAYKLLGSILLDQGEYKKTIKLLKPALGYAAHDYRLLFLLGTAYMQDGQHEQANALFEKASKLGVKSSKFQTEIGLNRLALGQNKLAAQDLSNAFENNPGNSKAGIPLTIIYITQGMPRKALDIATKMHQQTPDNQTLLNLLGTTQVAAGKYRQARDSFEKAINKDPGFITAQINLSKLDVIVKKSDIAIQRLNNLIKHYPENIALLIELARVNQVENNTDIATKLLNKALKVDSQSRTAKLALIELKLKTKHPAKALELALEAQNQHGKNMQVMDILARSFLATDNKSKASGVLQIMSRNAAFNSKQLFEIAQKQYAIRDYLSAIKSLKKAILGNQNYIPARVALANIELQHGELIFAKNQATFLTQNFPEHPSGYRLLADIALREGDNKLAQEHYQSAFNKTESTFLLMKLYTNLKQMGDHAAAYQLLEQWVKKHPQDIIPVQALAEEHLHANRLEQAQKYYERLLKQVGKQANILNNLAYIYFKSNDKRAIDYAYQAQELSPDSPITNDTLGWILVNQGQADRGLHFLRTAHARSSQNPEIRYHIAQALYQLQRHDEARTEVKSALKNNISFEGKKEAEQLLEKLNK